MATAVETVKNFMNVLKNYSQDHSQVGLIALDEAVRRVSYFSSLEEVATRAYKKLLEWYLARKAIFLPILAQLQATTLAVQPLIYA